MPLVPLQKNDDAENPYNILAFAALCLGVLDTTIGALRLNTPLATSKTPYALGASVLGTLFAAVGWYTFRRRDAAPEDYDVARVIIWTGLAASLASSFFLL